MSEKVFINSKNRSVKLLICGAVLLLSFITIAICSRSSFFYPINDWGDANIYFDIAKGLIHGKVPYRDLYDQKGPFMYFIYAVGLLFDEKDFLGIFVLEVIAAFVFLYTSYKIIKMYCKSDVAIVTLPLFAFAVYSSESFCQGGSAEEFILPIYMVIIYKMLDFAGKNCIKRSDAIIIGILTGIVFWTKFTLVGLSVFFCGYILFVYMLAKKYRELFQTVLNFLIGFVMSTILVLSYFGLSKSLMYLWNGYFYNNIFYYSNGSDGKTAINYLWWYRFHIFDKNPVVFVLFCIGIVYLVLKRKYELLVLSVGIYGFIFVELYAGGNCYTYYPLVASVCGIFGCVAVTELFLFLKNRLNLRNVCLVSLFLIMCLVSFLGSKCRTSNKDVFMCPKADTVQFRFADKINELSRDDQSVFVYKVMDEGFYQAVNQLPQTRFFCKTNLPLEEMVEEQDAYVKSKNAKFVIVRVRDDFDTEAPEYVEASGYTEADRVEAIHEREKFTYILYIRNEGTA